jgi:hypothetical protein
MAAVAVTLAVAIVRDRAGALAAAGAGLRMRPAGGAAEPPAGLAAYNAYLASLDRPGTFTRADPR